MRRFLVGMGVLVLILVAAVYAVSEARLRDRFMMPRESVRAATDSASVARGRHIAVAISGCAVCHGPDMGGQRFIDAMPFARWYAPNLTRAPGGASARLSDSELEAA